jgi:CoA-transferase family III
VRALEPLVTHLVAPLVKEQWARVERVVGPLDWPKPALFERDFSLGAAGRQVSPNGSCYLFAAADGWIALNLAREDDRDALPALVEGDAVNLANLLAAQPTAHWRERGILLDLPLAVVGEAKARLPASVQPRAAPIRSLPETRVLDLSTLWAGPLCAGLLAAAGAQVTRLNNPARPEPSAQSTPLLHARLNGQKAEVEAVLTADWLAVQLAQTDVVVTSARPLALARLGLDEGVFDRHPHLLWIAITAHGWAGEAARRVGFGDDCAAAGGLVHWVEGAPTFAGDALADPLTGLCAAAAAMEALAAGKAGLIDAALAPTAAYFAAETPA